MHNHKDNQKNRTLPKTALLSVALFSIQLTASPVSKEEYMTFDLVKDESQCAALKTEVMRQIEKEGILSYAYEKKNRKTGKVSIKKDRNEVNYKTDYTLWLESYDLDNNSVNDLIGVNWLPRGGRGTRYYLEVYTWLGKGYLIDDYKKKKYGYNKKLKAFIKSQPLKRYHGYGLESLVSEKFWLIDYNGRKMLSYFVGYQEIVPITLDGHSYLLARDRDNSRNYYLLFEYNLDKQALDLSCRFEA